MDMRKILWTAPLCLGLVIGATGCRQTTGPAMGGTFSTTSPLSPVNGQTPILGPFGGNTRVAPPSTGSFHSPAASAPISQPPPQYNPLGQQQYEPRGMNAPVGSGVQQATWTETNANVPGQPIASQNSAGASSDLRLGGMQVIDLTGAPNPPGYPPTGFAPNRFSPASVMPNNRAPNNAAPNLYPMQNFYPPAAATQPTYTPAPPAPNIYQAPTTWSASPGSVAAPPTSVPDPGRIASGELRPLPPPSQPAAMPVGNGQTPSTDLPWRRPGTRY
jgi:hypothetical protein